MKVGPAESQWLGEEVEFQRPPTDSCFRGHKWVAWVRAHYSTRAACIAQPLFALIGFFVCVGIFVGKIRHEPNLTSQAILVGVAFGAGIGFCLLATLANCIAFKIFYAPDHPQAQFDIFTGPHQEDPNSIEIMEI